MRKRYKVSLNIIGFLLVLSGILAISYIKYRHFGGVENTSVVVKDGLSINYLNGNRIKTNGEEKKYVISITNNTTDKLYYYIYTNILECNKSDIKYTLTERNNKLSVKENEFPMKEAYLASFIEIGGGETQTFELNILEYKHALLKANLEVGLEDSTEEYIATTIFKNNEVKKNPITKVGAEAATTNEGLIETTDDFGPSYYFRGDIQNNYLSFAGHMWRIVKINGDGSVKLILNDYIDVNSNFYNNESTETIDTRLNFNTTNIHMALENWYQFNLGGNEKYLSATKYCVDDSIGNMENNMTYYLGYSRLLFDYNQVNSCLGTKYNSKIGLLTADEVIHAGATNLVANTNYFLYIPNKETSWWTMTPASNDSTNINYFEVTTGGQLKADSIGSYYRGVRPVINLAKKTYVTGTGSITEPYTIKE